MGTRTTESLPWRDPNDRDTSSNNNNNNSTSLVPIGIPLVTGGALQRLPTGALVMTAPGMDGLLLQDVPRPLPTAVPSSPRRFNMPPLPPTPTRASTAPIATAAAALPLTNASTLTTISESADIHTSSVRASTAPATAPAAPLPLTNTLALATSSESADIRTSSALLRDSGAKITSMLRACVFVWQHESESVCMFLACCVHC